jgi:Uma2 family endonuclease
MYDLPSEDPEEPGLPDEYHDLQPQLLSKTFRCRRYPPERVFTGTDLNLYYDARHSLWHKRPDWFLVVGVSRLYGGTELRSSYVTWQEAVNPFVVVELLSPGTAKEDLGEYADAEAALEGENPSIDTQTNVVAEESNGHAKETPPRKWEVYEQILRVPYYIVFNRYTNRVRCFTLAGGHYQEQALNRDNPRIWIPELELGLGLWQGTFEGITRQWLRWYGDQDRWVPTDTELALELAEQERLRAEQERLRAEQERLRADRTAQQLRQVVRNLLQSGMSVEQAAALTGLSPEQVQGME